MKHRRAFRPRTNGFTLVEIAIVMAIIGLLLGGLMVPLSAQMDAQRMSETQKALNEARDALIGFALKNNGLLPRCSTTNDGTADAGCLGEGFLPWVDLGVGRTDAWGNPFRYRVDSTFVSAYTLSGANTIDALTMQDANSTALTQGDPNAAVAIILSYGKNGIADLENALANTVYTSDAPRQGVFDDQLLWLSRYALLNRLVSAQILNP